MPHKAECNYQMTPARRIASCYILNPAQIINVMVTCHSQEQSALNTTHLVIICQNQKIFVARAKEQFS